MMISKLFLKATYSLTQYLGAMIVCCGIIVVLTPQLTGKSTDEDNGHSQVVWAVVNIISCIPMALSSVFVLSNALRLRRLGPVMERGAA